MCSFLLSIIRCEDIDDGHEIDLLLRGAWTKKTTDKGWGTHYPWTQGSEFLGHLESEKQRIPYSPVSFDLSYSVGPKLQYKKACPS